VVLVEGKSDAAAVEALARRHGRDLAAERVAVIPIGGAQAIRRALARHAGAAVTGLCDEQEAPEFRRALGAATDEELAERGFFVCRSDLEDELIRALGVENVERVLEREGDLRGFRTLQKQPQWHGRPPHEQLRRFMGSGGRRKVRYASLLVEALPVDRIPRPLEAVLAAVR